MTTKPTSIPEALVALRDLRAGLALYRIGESDEPMSVPLAISTNHYILNALKVLIDHAELSERRSLVQASLMNEAADKMDELRRERDSALAMVKQLEESLDNMQEEAQQAAWDKDIIS